MLFINIHKFIERLSFLGNVHMYYITDFETIDFNNINCKKLTLDLTAVISINIVVHHGEYLIIAYKRKIYTVKLL